MINALDISDVMKKKLSLISAVMICNIAYMSCSDLSQWADYLGNSQRTAYSDCTGPDSLTKLWKVDLRGEFDTPPFIIDDSVLVLLKDSASHHWKSRIFSFDLLTGEVLHEVDDKPFFKIFPVGDQILGVSGLELYEIDPSSGKSTLLTSFSGRTFGGSLIYPVILEDRIVFPTTPVVCLSRSDFDTLWNLNRITREKDLIPGDLAGDETLIVFLVYTERGDRILSVNPSTGLQRWKSDILPFASWLALDDNMVYCAGERLWAFDRRESKLWEFIPEKHVISNIVVGPDSVYLADAAHNLYRIDLDGNLVWKTDWEGYVLCTNEGSVLCCATHLIGAGNILYCIGNFMDGGSQIAAYNMEDGSRMWSSHLEIPGIRLPHGLLEGPPAIADGILVIGDMWGNITAFASDPDLFVKQGDAFLSKGHTEEAINSYEKAAELHKKKGNLAQSQKIQERIHELENPLDSEPSTTSPTEPSTTPSESTHPESPKSLIPFSIALGLIGTSIGISIAYYIIRQRKIRIKY